MVDLERMSGNMEVLVQSEVDTVGCCVDETIIHHCIFTRAFLSD